MLSFKIWNHKLVVDGPCPAFIIRINGVYRSSDDLIKSQYGHHWPILPNIFQPLRLRFVAPTLSLVFVETVNAGTRCLQYWMFLWLQIPSYRGSQNTIWSKRIPDVALPCARLPYLTTSSRRLVLCRLTNLPNQICHLHSSLGLHEEVFLLENLFLANCVLHTNVALFLILLFSY